MEMNISFRHASYPWHNIGIDMRSLRVSCEETILPDITNHNAFGRYSFSFEHILLLTAMRYSNWNDRMIAAYFHDYAFNKRQVRPISQGGETVRTDAVQLLLSSLLNVRARSHLKEKRFYSCRDLIVEEFGLG